MPLTNSLPETVFTTKVDDRFRQSESSRKKRSLNKEEARQK